MDIWGLLTSPWLGRWPFTCPAASYGPGQCRPPRRPGAACAHLSLRCGWAIPSRWVISSTIAYHTSCHVTRVPMCTGSQHL